MMGRGMGMGGMGMGSPLLSTLLAGGMGYLFGSNAAQQAPQVQPYPPYPAPYPPAAMPASADNGSLAKLQLLGQLHEAVRERTLTVYTNVAKVIAALQIRSPETITILLVDRSGQISWRSEGVYAADKGAGLTQALAAGSG